MWAITFLKCAGLVTKRVDDANLSLGKDFVNTAFIDEPQKPELQWPSALHSGKQRTFFSPSALLLRR